MPTIGSPITQRGAARPRQKGAAQPAAANREANADRIRNSLSHRLAALAFGPGVADQLGAWVDGVETTFADRALPIDAATARRRGELSAARNLPVIDTLITATAIRRGLTLVTRNARDVESTGAPLVDPWRMR